MTVCFSFTLDCYFVKSVGCKHAYPTGLVLQKLFVYCVPLETAAFIITWWPFSPLGHKVPHIMSFIFESFVLYLFVTCFQKVPLMKVLRGFTLK